MNRQELYCLLCGLFLLFAVTELCEGKKQKKSRWQSAKEGCFACAFLCWLPPAPKVKPKPAPPSKPKAPAQPSGRPGAERATARYAWEPLRDNQLALAAGDNLEVWPTNESWWFARNARTGAEGRVMSGHVKVGPWNEDEDEDEDAAPAPAPVPPPAPKVKAEPAPKVKAEPVPAPAPAPKKKKKCILDTSSDEDEAPPAPADDSDTDLEEAGKKAEDVFVCRPGSGADTDGSDTDLSAAAPAPAANDSDTDLST